MTPLEITFKSKAESRKSKHEDLRAVLESSDGTRIDMIRRPGEWTQGFVETQIMGVAMRLRMLNWRNAENLSGWK